MGYERNVPTNTMLRRNGIEVISVARHLGPTYKIMQGSVGCFQRA